MPSVEGTGTSSRKMPTEPWELRRRRRSSEDSSCTSRALSPLSELIRLQLLSCTSAVSRTYNSACRVWSWSEAVTTECLRNGKCRQQRPHAQLRALTDCCVVQ